MTWGLGWSQCPQIGPRALEGKDACALLWVLTAGLGCTGLGLEALPGERSMQATCRAQQEGEACSQSGLPSPHSLKAGSFRVPLMKKDGAQIIQLTPPFSTELSSYATLSQLVREP